jgi:uncharacterized protein YuzE
MKISYDKDVDAAYIKMSDQKPSGVIEISEGLHVDITERGEIVGIEILEASTKVPLESLFTCEFDKELIAAAS